MINFIAEYEKSDTLSKQHVEYVVIYEANSNPQVPKTPLKKYEFNNMSDSSFFREILPTLPLKNISDVDELYLNVNKFSETLSKKTSDIQFTILTWSFFPLINSDGDKIDATDTKIIIGYDEGLSENISSFALKLEKVDKDGKRISSCVDFFEYESMLELNYNLKTINSFINLLIFRNYHCSNASLNLNNLSDDFDNEFLKEVNNFNVINKRDLSFFLDIDKEGVFSFLKDIELGKLDYLFIEDLYESKYTIIDRDNINILGRG